MRKLTVAAAVWPLLLAGCTGLPLTGLPIVPPDPEAPVLETVQGIELETAGGERHALIGAIERRAGRATLAVVTPIGLRLFTVIQDVAGLDVQRAAVLPERVDPEQIFAEVQFVNWPLAELRTALPRGWRVEENDGVRTLSHRGSEVARAVWRDAATVELTGAFTDHRLTIRTIDVAPGEQGG